MTVEELMKELSHLNPKSYVLVQDAHHFMRRHGIHRVEEQSNNAWGNPPWVVIVANEVKQR